MSTRDWSAIGLAEEPFPGDPDQVVTAASKYSAIAQSVLDSAASLRATTDTRDSRSAAIAEFTRLAADVATTMEAVHERYRTVADQLGGYAPQLASAQADGAAMYAAVVMAVSEQERQRGIVVYLEQQLLDAATSPESVTALERARAQAQGRLTEIESLLTHYRNQVDERRHELDAAAAAAAGIIDSVIAYSDLNDGVRDVLWDGLVVVSEWVVEHADVISAFIDAAAFLLTIVALAALFTGVGAPIAAALFAVARACNAISRVVLGAKIAATAVLVVDGKRPLSDLVVIGVDLAVGKAIDAGAGALAQNVAPRLLDAVDPHLLMLDDIAAHMDDAAIDLVLEELPLDFVPDLALVADGGIERFIAGALVEGTLRTAAQFDIAHAVGTFVVDPFVAPALHGAVESRMAPA